MCGRNHHKMTVAIAAAAFLSACASPEADPSASNFDEESYSVALAECRGGSVAVFMWDGLTSAAVGAAWGAAEGAQWGAIHGGVDESALIGSIVGGVLGIGVGAIGALSEHDDQFDRHARTELRLRQPLVPRRPPRWTRLWRFRQHLHGKHPTVLLPLHPMRHRQQHWSTHPT